MSVYGVGLLMYRCPVEKQAFGPFPFMLFLVGCPRAITSCLIMLPFHQKKDRPVDQGSTGRLHHWLPLPQVPIFGAKF